MEPGADAADPFTLTDANGAPILLDPGRTWVELADANSYTLRLDARVGR